MDLKDIIKNMATIKNNFDNVKKNSRDYYRILGSLEGMLVCIDKLPLMGKLPYKNVEFEKKSFFGRKSIVERKESYRELIIRLVEESIKEIR